MQWKGATNLDLHFYRRHLLFYENWIPFRRRTRIGQVVPKNGERDLDQADKIFSRGGFNHNNRRGSRFVVQAPSVETGTRLSSFYSCSRKKR